MAAPMVFLVTGARTWSRVSRAGSRKKERYGFPFGG